MKLWIDDIRVHPDESWDVARDSLSAMLSLMLNDYTLISFDHDLGEEWTGYDIAKCILNAVYSGKMKCPDYRVHSANPVGRKNIEMAMEQAKQIGEKK